MSARPHVLVKLGGEVVADPRLSDIAEDLRALVDSGQQVLVVHGGGPQATALSKQLGLEPRIIGGRRVTDAPTLAVMKMVIAGEVNVDLCAALRAAGLRPIGLSGVIRARKRPPVRVSGGGDELIDFGLVGDVVGFDLGLLALALDAGYVPVVACLGTDDHGAVYNINADIVANQLAIALRADPLVLVTSAPGVLGDIKDPKTRLPALGPDDARRAIADGTVQGGMIPKLEESFQAIAAGVQRIVITDRDVARAVNEPGSVGTTLHP